MAHGKNSRLLVDGATMTNIARGINASLIKETADATVIEDSSHVLEAGQQGGRLSVQAVYKGSQPNIQAALNSGIASDATHIVAFAPEGFAPGKIVQFGESHEVNASVTGDNKSVVSAQLAYEITGGFAVGISLFNPYL